LTTDLKRETFHGMERDASCPYSVRNGRMQEQILRVVEKQPNITIRHLAAHRGNFQASPQCITRAAVVYLSPSDCSGITTVLHNALARHAVCQ
jgi:hypothetical protein